MARKPKPKPKAKAKAKAKAKGTKPKTKPKGAKLKGGKLKAEELAKLKVVELPMFYASVFRLLGSGNDFNLICQRSVPVEREDGSIEMAVAVAQTVAVITISPQSLKDLHLLIGQQLEGQEKDFGRIKTQYTKRLAEQKP